MTETKYAPFNSHKRNPLLHFRKILAQVNDEDRISLLNLADSNRIAQALQRNLSAVKLTGVSQ